MGIRRATAAAVVAAATVAASCTPLGGGGGPAVGARVPPVETRVFQLAYVRPGTNVRPASSGPQEGRGRGVPTGGPLLALLEAMKSDRGTVAALEGANALVLTDTPEKLAAMDKLITEVDRPPKQVHLSVKLILLSDADAAKVRAESLPDWRPGETRAPVVLRTFDFAGLQAFLELIRMETRGSIIQLPQCVALDHEEATIDLEEGARYAWSFVQMSGPRQEEPAPKPTLKVAAAARLVVIPHVTGPENDVILTVVGAPPGPKPAQGGTAQAPGPVPKLPSTVSRVPVAKVKMRDRETAVVAYGQGEYRGEPVNVLVTVTPTVIDFEKKAGVDRAVARAREELGKGFSLEEEVAPAGASPERGAADAP